MLIPVRGTLIPGAVVLAVVGLILYVSPSQVLAKVGATLTKNVDEPGRAPYQASGSVIPSTCSFNSVLYFCDLALPAIPAGKRLLVEHISVFAALSAGSPDSVRFLNSNNSVIFWVQPTFTPRAGISSHFFLDRPVLVYYEPNETPTVEIALNGSPAAVQITVHGHLIDAAN